MTRRRAGRVPLARALSKLGLATRRDAIQLISEGRVTVGGRVIRDPAQLVIPERIAIAIDAVAAAVPRPTTIVLHKPRGVVTTRRDPDGRSTVYDLIHDLDTHVVPVGRLDVATSGLLLMTNDTRLADWLTNPRNAVPRVYLVTVRGRMDAAKADTLTRGVSSEGETLTARSVEVRKASGRESLAIVELTQGRNREIRRMMKAIGHDVTRLRRVQFGGLTLEDLPPGKWRRLSARELEQAFPRAPFSRQRNRASSRPRPRPVAGTARSR